MDQLSSIRIFLEIAETGSFAAAAERLDISAPMVSKHVAALEKWLGARLLNRSSRHVSLTEAGALYQELCRQALDILDAADTAVGSEAAAPRGHLRISAPVWCATRQFAETLAEYRRRYPEVRLDLHLDNHHVDLAADGFDLALRVTQEPSPALIARPLCEVAFHLVAAPGYRGGASLQLIMPSYVNLGPGDLPGLAGTSKPGGPGAQADVVMRSSDTTLSHHAALAGIGAALLPGSLIEEDLAQGRLRKLVPAPEFTRTLFAVYASRKHMPLKLRTFIDFLAERLRV
ncbi:MAG: LysR family transcriptional regulator [Candidatus Protistobacter heckmanni]|nr:LysR family transcriptional regulator [Candidatus Protistobacter heckmanni]